MRVRRTLPQRERTLVGAWCFADHYGPDEVDETGGMVVPPHPHTGLQTVSWLFAGEIEHRDSAGHHALVRPGELNLMTGGRGVSHSEVSTPGTTTLHGVQLWVALPDDARDAPGRLRALRPAGAVRFRLAGQRVPRLVARPHLAGSHGDAPARRRAGAGARHHPRARRRRDLRARRPPRLRLGRRRRPAGQAGRARVRRARARVLDGRGPRGEPARAARWAAVRRADRDVVELRRPHPRRGRPAREEWQAQITRDGEVVADGQDVVDGRFGSAWSRRPPPTARPADCPSGPAYLAAGRASHLKPARRCDRPWTVARPPNHPVVTVRER